MTEAVYHRLVSGEGLGEHFDRHVFACAIAVLRGDPAQPSDVRLSHALGLSPDALSSLFQRLFPDALDLMPWMVEDEGEGEMQIEEEDLRALLLAHRAGRGEQEVWLAHILARRSMAPNHLWQDLGLPNRDDLNALMERNFPALKARNAGNMKWKKFFYRELCQTEGILVCKSPHCEACEDFAICFGDEAGQPLLAHCGPQNSTGTRLPSGS